MVANAFTQSVRPLLAKFGIEAPDIRIEGLALDSRQVAPRQAFIALKGHELDGREFIPQAISLGAKVILAQTDDSGAHGAMEMRAGTVIVHLFDLPAMLSSLAAAFYDYPASKLDSIAVTGTNGKTSVVQLISQLTSLAGTRCAAIGTLGSGVYEGTSTQWAPSPANNTTPDAIAIQALLADFVLHEVRQVAFEASSHAIVQGRLSQVKTDIAVFTNLSRDHLDYHHTMEDYAKAKRGLLAQPGLKTLVVNADDAESANWINNAPAHIEPVLTSMDKSCLRLNEYRYCLAGDVQYHQAGVQFMLQSSWGNHQVNVPLLGTFNVRNILSAVAVTLTLGEPFDNIIRLLPLLKPVDGRMEVFEFKHHANVVVDYAHTPDALIKVLQSARVHTQGQLWCVFGCGGDRDKGKRPLMGNAGEQYADHIVITNDNSRSEAPQAIADDICSGLANPENAVFIEQREAAIRYCLDNAGPQDMIIVAGKGHEEYQIIGNTKNNYNERAVIARLQMEYNT
ncbi:UDP-N-acetylmuramoyl-L-alanyl-D-glutamate--2,6-diaminopimelate ligase [Alteromonas lipotrueiana]|uniref:UDP-N-acetylmuramoyl-L-alanyl-D-glutamate--2, 6-diaminopimelate ligase n=1 Tax=Alteromonas lipotrueiana TaxID=2803815 RepID=UPI001C46C18A|nr:UDP-N-acetylmuramoyl-L-alanyl-D-glutamate--2,6-diaminopimelate ligase [Alteromonas lipotrueiana]